MALRLSLEGEGGENEAMALKEDLGVLAEGYGVAFRSSAEFISWPLDDWMSCEYYCPGTAINLTALHVLNSVHETRAMRANGYVYKVKGSRFARQSVKHGSL